MPIPLSWTRTTACILGVQIDVDAATRVRVLHGVHQDVGDDLLGAHRVHLHRHRFQLRTDVMLGEAAGDPQDVDGVFDHLAQVNRGPVQDQAAGGDLGHVEEVVDDPHQV